MRTAVTARISAHTRCSQLHLVMPHRFSRRLMLMEQVSLTPGRGVVPVKFSLTLGGVATCDLPPATITVTRTAGGAIGPIDESLYGGSADTGSNFRIDSCQYAYNLSSGALGPGTYRIDISIGGSVVGSGTFGLK